MPDAQLTIDIYPLQRCTLHILVLHKWKCVGNSLVAVHDAQPYGWVWVVARFFETSQVCRCGSWLVDLLVLVTFACGTAVIPTLESSATPQGQAEGRGQSAVLVSCCPGAGAGAGRGGLGARDSMILMHVLVQCRRACRCWLECMRDRVRIRVRRRAGPTGKPAGGSRRRGFTTRARFAPTLSKLGGGISECHGLNV